MAEGSDRILERCSEACTRAGIAALLLTAVAFSLQAPVRNIARLDVYGKYVTARIKLKFAVEDVAQHPVWRKLLKTVGEEMRHWPLNRIEQRAEQLQQEMAQDEARGITIQAVGIDPHETTEPVKEATPETPSPPRIASITVVLSLNWFGPGSDIGKALTALDDTEPQGQAAEYSNDVRFRIVRWQRLRNHIFRVTRDTDGLDVRRKYLISSFKQGMGLLSWTELEQLANTEMDEASFFDREAGNFRAAVPWLPERINAYSAAELVSVSMCFVVFYFWLYVRHARAKAAKLVDGTLFAAISQDRWSRYLFTLVALAPASALLALVRATDGGWGILGCAVVVVIGTLGVLHECWELGEHKT